MTPVNEFENGSLDRSRSSRYNVRENKRFSRGSPTINLTVEAASALLEEQNHDARLMNYSSVVGCLEEFGYSPTAIDVLILAYGSNVVQQSANLLTNTPVDSMDEVMETYVLEALDMLAEKNKEFEFEFEHLYAQLEDQGFAFMPDFAGDAPVGYKSTDTEKLDGPRYINLDLVDEPGMDILYHADQVIEHHPE